LGVYIGGRLGRRRPEGILVLAMLMAAGGCALAAVNYTKFTSLLAALLATMAGSMGKLALDAIIQRDIIEDTRNSAFARSETALQLAWVGGGAFGLIEMPGPLGFGLSAALIGLTLVLLAGPLRRARVAARTRRVPLAATATVAYQDGLPPGRPGKAAVPAPTTELDAAEAYPRDPDWEPDPDATNPLGPPPTRRLDGPP
jgi:hypothetical protein